MSMANMTKLNVTYGDVTLGVSGDHFRYIFAYDRGGLESLVRYGKEWLYRTPMPAFWRATTDNDRGNGFSQQSAMGWELMLYPLHQVTWRWMVSRFRQLRQKQSLQ